MLCSWPFLFSSHPVKREQFSHEPAYIHSWVSSKLDEINNSLGGGKEKYQPLVFALNDPLFPGFLIFLWRKQLCQTIPIPFEVVSRKTSHFPPSCYPLTRCFLSKWANEICECICCFMIPPSHGIWIHGWVSTWVGQPTSTVGTGKENLSLMLRMLFFQWSWKPFILKCRGFMPFNDTAQWYIFELITVRIGEKRQIISPWKFQPSGWVWGRVQFLRFHLLFLESGGLGKEKEVSFKM